MNPRREAQELNSEESLQQLRQYNCNQAQEATFQKQPTILSEKSPASYSNQKKVTNSTNRQAPQSEIQSVGGDSPETLEDRGLTSCN